MNGTVRQVPFYFMRFFRNVRRGKVPMKIVAPIQNLETFTDRNFSIGLVVIDKAGNRSQYVESETIVLKKL